MIELLTQISIIKTIIFNFHYWGIKGIIRRYALVSKKTFLKKMQGNIVLDSPKRHCLRIGFGHNEILDYKYERTIFFNEGTIIIRGTANFNQGFRVFNRGVIEFGDNFVVTGNSSVICMKHVVFGNDCLMSWGVSVMDTDFHKIILLNNKKVINPNKDVVIGSHCWICSNVTILKGAVIPDNCVIGSGSTTAKEFLDRNSIILGNRVLRENVNWMH